jgi:hypothetical protein
LVITLEKPVVIISEGNTNALVIEESGLFDVTDSKDEDAKRRELFYQSAIRHTHGCLYE